MDPVKALFRAFALLPLGALLLPGCVAKTVYNVARTGAGHVASG